MTDQLWSWALSIVGLAGLFLAGKKIWWAWYLNIAGQALWFAYAIVTEQYGFLVAAFGYTFVFAKNAIAWTKEHFDENEGWDFNEYAHLQEMMRDYATEDVEMTMRMYHDLPRKEYCYGYPIHPDCPIQDIKHTTHSWIETRV